MLQVVDVSHPRFSHIKREHRREYALAIWDVMNDFRVHLYAQEKTGKWIYIDMRPGFDGFDELTYGVSPEEENWLDQRGSPYVAKRERAHLDELRRSR